MGRGVIEIKWEGGSGGREGGGGGWRERGGEKNLFLELITS